MTTQTSLLHDAADDLHLCALTAELDDNVRADLTQSLVMINLAINKLSGRQQRKEAEDVLAI